MFLHLISQRILPERGAWNLESLTLYPPPSQSLSLDDKHLNNLSSKRLGPGKFFPIQSQDHCFASP